MIYTDEIREMSTSAYETGYDSDYYSHTATATLQVKSSRNDDHSLAFVYILGK